MPSEKRPANVVPKGPPPGSRVPPHKVDDNESFETLALKYGVTSKEIIQHNFGTADAGEINWYLREYVGCKLTTQDKRNWRFSRAASPGLVYIPDKAPPKNPVVESAMRVIDNFAKKLTPGAFPTLDRALVATQLRARVLDPSGINQGQSGLCPSAAVVYTVAKTNPVEYVKAVTQLFDVGTATIGKWKLEPDDDLRFYKLPTSPSIPQADWIIMASIRDSENWFIDYQAETDKGGAWGNEVAKWLTKAGYTTVKEDWNSVANKSIAHLKTADDLYSKGYQVCLLVDKDLLESRTATLSRPNHWVVLASNISTNFLSPSSNVSMQVFTWGSVTTLPDRAMTLDDFVDYYYGYVAAKY